MFFELGKWVFATQDNFLNGGIDCLLFSQENSGHRSVMNPNGSFTRLPVGDPAKSPSMTLSYTQLQAIMDGLWERGVRPQDRRFDNEVTLIKDHLNDLKRLVFERRIK